MAGNKSLWMATTPAPSFPSLEGRHRCQVLVIGAGITGITTALLLARKGLSVTVIERHTVCSGATGNTTGKVTSQHRLTYTRLRHAQGYKNTRIYGEANQA